MKKLFAFVLSLTFLFLIVGCGAQGDTSPSEDASDTDSGAAEILIERMKTIKADDLIYITAISDRVSAKELASALNEAAAHGTDRAEAGPSYYSLEAYLTGSPEGYSSEDEHFTFFAGLEDNMVEVLYHKPGNEEDMRMLFDDETLYRLIRNNYRTETKIDQEDYEKYREILTDRMENSLQISKEGTGASGFTGYELASFYKENTFTDGEDTYVVYEWNPVFTTDDPDRVLWAGGMYLDADARVCAFEQYTYFVVKNPDTGSQDHRFLFWDLYFGEDEAAAQKNALLRIRQAFESDVRAQWAEKALSSFSDHDEFTADEAEPQSQILFSVEHDIKDFKFLALQLEDVDEDGRVTFSSTELYSEDTLTPDRPLLVKLTFFGLIPNYGISYVDESGMTRNYAVSISGENGALLLIEF